MEEGTARPKSSNPAKVKKMAEANKKEINILMLHGQYTLMLFTTTSLRICHIWRVFLHPAAGD
jgi:hypothetical protein